ncbi:MAG TPA: DUF1801 domain-containing protein [Longimicrobiaceae bacterium]|nr:DUF1801 domain-containing protein [Longimicrobiaceae bacterium]
MASSSAATVEEYLRELPEDRRTVVSRVREVILRSLPHGYRESMSWGMISYEIPLERYPDTYNGRPLGYVALAAQKNHYALYLMGVYGDPEQETRLREEFRKAGKKLDMGKACLRFRKLEDLPLDAIGQVVAGIPPEGFIARYEASRRKS